MITADSHAVMALVDCKLLLAAAVFCAGWLPGAAASRVARAAGSTVLVGLANAFAAGIILGIGLLHLLPEAHEEWGEIAPGFPVAFVLAAAAFLLFLLIEHVVLARRGHVHGEVSHGRHEITDEVGVHARDRRMAAYALLAGLSTHSLLEGIALGVQRSQAAAVAILFAVLAHKSTEGFALGVSLARAAAERRRARNLIAVFALATPLGIGAGALLSEALPEAAISVVDATFTALAAGTFIYIAVLEILGEEYSHGSLAFQNWCCTCAGLAFSALLALLL